METAEQRTARVTRQSSVSQALPTDSPLAVIERSSFMGDGDNEPYRLCLTTEADAELRWSDIDNARAALAKLAEKGLA